MSYASEVAADSPLAWYRMGESSGTTIADSSGNGRDATIASGGVYTLGTTSLLATDTANTCIDLTGACRIDGTYGAWLDVDYFTAEAWVNADTTGSNRTIFIRDNTGSSTQIAWRLRIAAGKAQALLKPAASPTQTLNGATTLSVGATYHLAMTYDGTTLRLYVNGVQDGSLSISGVTAKPSGIPIRIGALSGGTEQYDGRIDECAFYGSALSAARILAHYQAGANVIPTGSFAASLPLPSPSFTGSYTPPPVTGSMSASLPMPIPAFTGSYTAPPTGSLDATLAVPAASFSGSYVGSIAASLAVDLPVPVVDLTGGYTPPAISGTLDASLPLPSVDFTGSAALAEGSLDADLILPTVSFVGEYGGPYPTDTSNARHGRRRLAYATVTIERPVAAPPETLVLATRVDKAVAYPVPTMVDGRPT